MRVSAPSSLRQSSYPRATDAAPTYDEVPEDRQANMLEREMKVEGEGGDGHYCSGWFEKIPGKPNRDLIHEKLGLLVDMAAAMAPGVRFHNQ